MKYKKIAIGIIIKKNKIYITKAKKKNIIAVFGNFQEEK